MFLTKSIIAKVQFENKNNEFLISDFENKFFNDLDSIKSKKE